MQSQNHRALRRVHTSNMLHWNQQYHHQQATGTLVKVSEVNITTTTTTTVLRPFVRDYPGEPVPEKTFTHSSTWSSTILYHLLPSTTIYSILPIQFTCLTIFLYNLSPSSLWSTSWSGALHFILHTFLTQSVSSFCNICPYHRNPFCCSAKIISSIPSLSLSQLYLDLYLLP